MLCIALVDFLYCLIPSGLTYALAASGLIHAGQIHYCSFKLWLPSFVLLSVFGTLYRFSFLMTKKRMMGQGDIRLACAAGMFVPLDGIPLFLFMSSALCLFATGTYSLIKRRVIQKSPFGPYLCLAMLYFILR